MAYTIISQNNNTTTLTDGVNTITVPSRVNLTSGNFTIVEVNNNMATLEDGDGNVYRDIPCVATLAGEGGGGGSSLPDQTGHSGEFLTTDGTDASWAAVNALQNTATGTNSLTISGTAATQDRGTNIGFLSQAGNNGTACGVFAQATGQESTAVGDASKASKAKSIAIGRLSEATAQSAIAINGKATASYAIQIGGGSGGYSNSNADTFKVANSNGNFEIMSADGTIPTARLTKVNSTTTLAAADWSAGTQTVSVTGVTATGIVFVSPDPTDQSAYTSAGIICTSQATNSLTFTATSTPASDLTVNVVML